MINCCYLLLAVGVLQANKVEKQAYEGQLWMLGLT